MTIDPTIQTQNWTGAQKAVLRFFVIFFALYMVLLNTTDVFPFLYPVFDYFIKPFQQFAIYAGNHTLRLSKPITVFSDGSGDTTLDYVALFMAVVIAGIGATIWSLADRKARNYDKLLYWVCAALRYYLACAMLSYGFQKIIKIQFPTTSPSRLVQPIGTMSPMGLAWLYMGYSTGFNYFTGFGEVLGGLLLLSRRTTVIGSLLVLVITGNIMAINYCFDVPVKLYSTGLTAMAIFLLIRNARPLIDLFFLKKTVTLSSIEPHRFSSRRKNLALESFKYIFIAYALIMYIKTDLRLQKKYGDNVEKPPFYGIYNADDFVRNNDTIAPLITDSTRWRRFIVDMRTCKIILMNDSGRTYKIKTDTIKHTFTLKRYTDTTKKFLLSYTKIANGGLQLKGKWGGDSIKVNLTNYSLEHFTLLNRGYHWINEFPFHK